MKRQTDNQSSGLNLSITYLLLFCGFISNSCASRDVGQTASRSVQGPVQSEKNADAMPAALVQSKDEGNSGGKSQLGALTELGREVMNRRLNEVQSQFQVDCDRNPKGASAEFCRLKNDSGKSELVHRFLCSAAAPEFCRPSLDSIASLEQKCGAGVDEACVLGTAFQAAAEFPVADAAGLCRLGYVVSCARVIMTSAEEEQLYEVARRICGARADELWALRSLRPRFVVKRSLPSGLETFGSIAAMRNELCLIYIERQLKAGQALEASVLRSQICQQYKVNDAGPPAICKSLPTVFEDFFSETSAWNQLESFCGVSNPINCALALSTAAESKILRRVAIERLDQMCSVDLNSAACNGLVQQMRLGRHQMTPDNLVDACAHRSQLGCVWLVSKFALNDNMNKYVLSVTCSNPRSLYCFTSFVASYKVRGREWLSDYKKQVCKHYSEMSMCR